MGNAPADEVVLYNSSLSPFGQRVTIALKEKRISYEVSPVDLFNKTEEFLALNPVHKQVPVLVHQGHPVLESAIILEYIDEAWPSEPLLIPRDPVQRSVARFWVDFINRFLGNLIDIVHTNGHQWDNAKLKSVAQFKALDGALADGPSRGTPYFLGNQLGVVDICFAPFAAMIAPLFEKLGGFRFPSAEECPRMHAWMEALEKNPTVAATAIDLKPCIELAETVFQKTREGSSVLH